MKIESGESCERPSLRELDGASKSPEAKGPRSLPSGSGTVLPYCRPSEGLPDFQQVHAEITVILLGNRVINGPRVN